MTEKILEKNHFTLRRSRQIEEMQGTLWEMEHEKSGAKLVWLQRQEENAPSPPIPPVFSTFWSIRC